MTATPGPASLNVTRRAADLERLSGETVDLLVVGGGVTGCGVALDAAARGLSVCLLEAHDLGFGTSRWSSKLVHGGLRYLASGDVGLAWESARERGILMTSVAPHLTTALPQLVPLHDGISHRKAAITMTGLVVGDALRRLSRTPSSVLPGPRRIGAPGALRRAPGLLRSGLRGGLLSYDGQLVDDVRLVVGLARTAAGYGARIVTGARVTLLEGGAASVQVDGQRMRVNARAVVNATGVWAGGLADEISLRPSRGSHLVLDAAKVRIGSTAVTIPIPGSQNRFAFLLPQQGDRVYLGLTDEPVDGPIPDVPEVPESDVTQLLDIASSVLEVPLGATDVLGAFAGLRPLVAAPDGAEVGSADLSRRHLVHTGANGVITVVGGKLTTYRRMAADAVDAAVAAAGLPARGSATASLGLVGAAPRAELSTLDVPERLVARYGTEAEEVAALGGAPVGGSGLTEGEVRWAVRQEGARCADDVLDRRSRIGLVAAERAAVLEQVQELVAQALESPVC